jgi:hypothetical protein
MFFLAIAAEHPESGRGYKEINFTLIPTPRSLPLIFSFIGIW